MHPIYVILIVISSIILLLFAFAGLIYHFAFGNRQDKNPLLKYFSASDFSLTADEFTLGKLSGAIYENKSAVPKNGVIIFAHGMGPGHCAYTTEIAYFCNLGYTVVAVDSLGCGFSQGKGIRGMYEGANTVIQTIDFVKRQFAGSKIYLVGHSWGAYSVLCASRERQVDKVVAISAPSTPVKTVYGATSPILSKPFAAVLSPFWYLINFFKFGKRGNSSAVKCVENNSTPTLIIHGDKDAVVSRKHAVYYAAEGKHITKYLAEGKAHNPYNTVAAEAKLAELTRALQNCKKMAKEEREEFFKNFDYNAATEEDPSVMRVISDFLEVDNPPA